jgi:BirA family biotin operon repressor/biotin-[acetyl-CoA-carboxylase] ligase
LSSPRAGLDGDALRAGLATVSGLGPIVVVGTTGSSNDEARRLAQQGAPAGTVVIAESQTAGRGRHGRSWHSPPETGLYLSVLLRPASHAADVLRFTLAASVAACEACRAVGAAEVGIKWPNDLWWRGRKVAGTLAELRSAGGQVCELVVGTGFNVNQEEGDFPSHLVGVASVRMARGGRPVAREALAIAYLERLAARAAQASTAEGFASIRAAWGGLAALGRGARVRVVPVAGAPAYEAVALGLDRGGALRVREEGAEGAAVSVLTLAESVEPLGVVEA